MDLLIASQNQGKLKEFRRLLADWKLTIIGLGDVGLGTMDVEETGTSFVENALLKAHAYAQASGKLTLADDSGLAVDALEGRPGVYSARYGRAGLDDAGRRAYLLDEMREIPLESRSAHFVCVIALYDPKTGVSATVEGRCEGRILLEERNGGQGFGYDALFLPDGFEKTFAELSPEEKNAISHRGHAVAQVPALLRQFGILS